MKLESLAHEQDLKQSFLQAMLVHGALFILLFLAAKFEFLPGLNVLKPLSPEVKMLQTAVRVDVVAMPTQTLKELKAQEMAPAPEKIEEAAKVPEVKVEAPKEKEIEAENAPEFKKVGAKKDFRDMLKNLSQKEIKAPSSSGKKTGAKKGKMTREEINSLIIAGNKISQGNSLTGTTGTADFGAFAEYVSAMPFRVKPFWKLPSYLLGRNLKCRVRVYIAASGELIKATVFESSGVAEFDERAIQAVEAASPFPAPEDAFKKRLTQGEIALGFPL